MDVFSRVSVFWGLAYFGVLPALSAGQCDAKRVPAETKSLMPVFQRAEKLTLGENIPKTGSQTAELIYRAKTRNWKDYAWSWRPLEFLLAHSAQTDYALYCAGSGTDFLTQFTQDFATGAIPARDAKKFLRAILLLTPCLEGESLLLAQGILTRDFIENTDTLVDLLIATESEAPRFGRDFKVCSSPHEKSKHILVDALLPALEKVVQDRTANKNMFLRLKRIRPARMHFETARYLFQQLDSFVAE